MENAITARGLTKNFGELIAVNNLDLDVTTGSIYGFLGPNGCGKSTTIRLLCGLLTPSAGEAEVLGLDIKKDAERLKEKIGYMTQSFSLYEDLSVLENLRFIGEIYALPRKKRNRRIDCLLEEYHLQKISSQRAGTLSGGQRQRLALAAAILHEPKLLFLDEPTSAVDPQNRRDFWGNLFDLADSGTTILVSTHYMDEAARCHRLAILDDGIKVADGSPLELANNISLNIIEVVAEDPNAARKMLHTLNEVTSVTQLGLHLRVLIPKAIAQPLELVTKAMQNAKLAARINTVQANLEDVFVAVTEARRQGIKP